MTHPFEVVVAERFGGLLRHGKHDPDGLACVLEAASIARGGPWSDDPEAARLPDIRSLNDARWTDAARTAAMVPLVVALWDWSEWPERRRIAWARRVAERTIREVLPIALRAAGLEVAAVRCEADGNASAASAASAAAYAAASAASAASAAYAASNASNAAYAAAYAASAASAASAAAYAASSAAAYAAAYAASSAAYAAAASSASSAASAAYAAYAASAASNASNAASAAAASVLALTCRIWIEEATR